MPTPPGYAPGTPPPGYAPGTPPPGYAPGTPPPGYAAGTPPQGYPAYPPHPGYTPTTPVGGAQRGFGPPGGPGPGGWGPLPAPAPARGPGVPHPGRWAGLVALVLAQLLVGLQVGSFNVSVPEIARTLHMGFGQLSWLATTSALAFAALVVLGGQVSDVTGRRPVLAVGLVVLALGSAIEGLAPTDVMMFVARALEGMGGALVTAAALALVVTNFPDRRERRTALGIYAAIAGSGTALGFLVGGSAEAFLSWRVSEFAVVPLAVLALVGALTLLGDEAPGRGARVDPAAVAFGTGGMLVIAFALSRALYLGAGLVLALVVLAGLPLFAAFLWRRSARADAQMPQAGTDANRFGAGIALVSVGAAPFAVFSSVGVLLQLREGFSPFVVGLVFLSFVVAVFVGALVSGRLSDRVAPRALLVQGLVPAGLGLVLLTFAWNGGGLSVILPGLFVVGLGTGWALLPLFAVATSGLASTRAGAASSTVGAALQVGAAIGGAAFSVPLLAFDNRYATALWVAAGLLALGGLVAGLTITARPAAPAGAPQDGTPGWAP
nr:MFS transporter [Streptacidiphilus jiangxiensis]